MQIEAEVKILNRIFNNYFSSSKCNLNDRPKYYVRVLSISNDKSEIYAEFSFKKEETYCCSELTCHFSADWEKIRGRAKESGVALAKPLIIRFKVFVEKGAKFEVHKSIGLPLESEAHEYNELFSESRL